MGRGPLTGDLVVETTHPRRPERAIPITGFVQNQLTVSPPRVDLGTFAGIEPRKASLIVTNFGNEPVRITEIETDVEGLRTEVKEHDDARRFDLHLTLEPGHPPGPIDGRMTIHTTSDRLPRLEVPIRGTIQ